MPYNDRKQGRYRKNADIIMPLNPSMIAPKYIPTFMMDPGSRKATGKPSQNCCKVRSQSQRKLAQKQAKMVLTGPMIKQPTKQNTSEQMQMLSGDTLNHSHNTQYTLTKITMACRPNILCRLEFLNRFYDFELIFFFVQISMYKEIIAPTTRQKLID